MADTGRAQEDALGQIRQEIDAIDRQLHQLLNQRARCAQQVAEVKAQYQQDKVVYYRPEREAQVLRKVMERNEGPLPDAEVARLFREVMSVCLALEQPLRVVFPGTLSSRSHQASMKQFGQSADFHAVDTIDAIFAAVASGQADYGIVPIERVEPELAEASVLALAKYNLALCGEVSDFGSRYLVIGDQLVGPSGEDKTALLIEFNTAYKDSSLNDSIISTLDKLFETQTLYPTAQIAIDVDNRSLIYVDFEGHSSAPQVIKLLAEIEQQAVSCRLLGSFPMAVL